ncbi:MAG: hypothetical protein JO162_05245 [Alphaproteobacteria bacterium]|nr:hypothetical protein [Alphaproteobacteria bacterium]
MNQPLRRAASEPQLPGPIGKNPAPNPVVISTAGCHHGNASEVTRINSPAVPAKAGTHLSAALAFQVWTPAFAGAAV